MSEIISNHRLLLYYWIFISKPSRLKAHKETRSSWFLMLWRCRSRNPDSQNLTTWANLPVTFWLMHYFLPQRLYDTHRSSSLHKVMLMQPLAIRGFLSPRPHLSHSCPWDASPHHLVTLSESCSAALYFSHGSAVASSCNTQAVLVITWPMTRAVLVDGLMLWTCRGICFLNAYSRMSQCKDFSLQNNVNHMPGRANFWF